MRPEAIHRREINPEQILSAEEQTGADRVRTLIEGLRLSDRAEEADATLYLRVYRALRRALSMGAAAPGDLLNIRPIAAALRTSPMPVREALGRLAAEGALEPLANRAFRLPVLGPEKYRELLLVRLRLEGLAGEHAAVRVTIDEFAVLRGVHEAIIAKVKWSLRQYQGNRIKD
jgi:DNA-binding GntR family transcriptional regulator